MSFDIGRNVASYGILSNGSVLVCSRQKSDYSWVYHLIEFGPGNERGEHCATLKQKCYGMTEMLLEGRKSLAIT